MLMRISSFPRSLQAGVVLMEVLVTIIILAFGLLGLAGLQAKIQAAEMESYQRGQALWLVQDMAARLQATATRSNPPNASGYLTTTAGTDADADCSTKTGAARDLCEWNLALKGSAEVTSGGSKAGAMIDARGCISEIQPPNNTTGFCAPGIYRIDVVWQGLHPTTAPSVDCGEGSYGDDSYRRAVSLTVTLGVPLCLHI